jgi:hypothetical protein
MFISGPLETCCIKFLRKTQSRGRISVDIDAMGVSIDFDGEPMMPSPSLAILKELFERHGDAEHDDIPLSHPLAMRSPIAAEQLLQRCI